MNRFMKIVPLLVLPAAAAVATGFAVPGCDQPKIQCTSGHGEFAAKLTLVNGTGACAGLKGAKYGVQSYVKGMAGERPTFDKPPVAIKADEIGQLLAEYEQEVADEKQLSSTGDFADVEPDSLGFCKVNQMSVATLMLAAKPASVDMMGKMIPALPAVSLRYEWSDLKFFVSAGAPGTQFTAKLKYTKDGCTAEYDVVGLAPAVGCELTATVTGADGKPMTMATGMPDDTLCSPCADIGKKRARGSGISPDVETVCDPGALLCVPKKAPPSLLATPIRCAPTPPPAMTGGGA